MTQEFLLNLPIEFEQLVKLILQLPTEYQERLVDILSKNSQKDPKKISFQEWNGEFENQNLDEYLPEYGMTLLEFRQQQYADEMDTTSQMNEIEFNNWINQTWKSQIVK